MTPFKKKSVVQSLPSESGALKSIWHHCSNNSKPPATLEVKCSVLNPARAVWPMNNTSGKSSSRFAERIHQLTLIGTSSPWEFLYALVYLPWIINSTRHSPQCIILKASQTASVTDYLDQDLLQSWTSLVCCLLLLLSWNNEHLLIHAHSHLGNKTTLPTDWLYVYMLIFEWQNVTVKHVFHMYKGLF